jgi:hypothetical protein
VKRRGGGVVFNVTAFLKEKSSCKLNLLRQFYFVCVWRGGISIIHIVRRIFIFLFSDIKHNLLVFMLVFTSFCLVSVQFCKPVFKTYNFTSRLKT